MDSVYASSSANISLKPPRNSDSNSFSGSRNWVTSSSGSGHKVGSFSRSLMENKLHKVVVGDAGYVLEDVPHFSDYIPHLPVRRRSLPYLFIARQIKKKKTKLFFFFWVYGCFLVGLVVYICEFFMYIVVMMGCFLMAL